VAAVADFDQYSPEPPVPLVRHESIAPAPEPQPADRAQPEPVRISTAVETAQETAQEAERAAARRRSTVREKVSFLTAAQPDAPAPGSHGQPAPAASPAPTPAQSAPEAADDNQPRRAGWWSRRFGNGE
jgi:ribonuclease E